METYSLKWNLQASPKGLYSGCDAFALRPGSLGWHVGPVLWPFLVANSWGLLGVSSLTWKLGCGDYSELGLRIFSQHPPVVKRLLAAPSAPLRAASARRLQAPKLFPVVCW